jgi:hypothetical protein
MAQQARRTQRKANALRCATRCCGRRGGARHAAALATLCCCILALAGARADAAPEAGATRAFNHAMPWATSLKKPAPPVLPPPPFGALRAGACVTHTTLHDARERAACARQRGRGLCLGTACWYTRGGNVRLF